ncbi:MAG: hypothetical protein OXH39_05300 [Candidatus Poribacteria bacterium]|nr:hypothetical protein [Candidatus Poribacteria bacterium]
MTTMKFFGSIVCLLAFIFSAQNVHVQQSLAADQQSPNKTPQESNVTFQLIESIRFADGTTVKSIAKDKIDTLPDLPIRLGLNDHIDGVTLTKKRDDTVYVRTCREYDEARKQGYYPNSNFDYKMSFFFMHPCGLLNALEKASVPKQNFISDAEVSILNLELLPFQIFAENLAGQSSWDAPRDLETTYQQKIDNQELVITEKSQNVLYVEGSGMGQTLKEMVRADFNNDGIEDVLLFEHNFVKKGTFADAGIIVLTRKSVNGKFEVLRPLASQQPTGFPYWLK